MAIINEHKAIIQPLNPIWYQPCVPQMDMLRLDLIHPVISGNKWFKLKYNLEVALAKGYKSMLTFGGAYSNHLVATAAIAKEYGLSSIGIIRGNYAKNNPTATMDECKSYGMQLVFVSWEDYAKKTDEAWLKELSAEFNNPYIIPEGGANDVGRKGAEDIAKMIPDTYTHVCLSAGTGTTLVGLRNALPAAQKVLGFVPMKEGRYIKEEIEPYLQVKENWQLFDEWNLGGFGKWNNKLLAFMNNFYRINNIPLDIIYTSKMMYGLDELLLGRHFPDYARILCIHTGGLQGNSSVQDFLSY